MTHQNLDEALYALMEQLRLSDPEGPVLGAAWRAQRARLRVANATSDFCAALRELSDALDKMGAADNADVSAIVKRKIAEKLG
jgi:hypothetical protein